MNPTIPRSRLEPFAALLLLAWAAAGLAACGGGSADGGGPPGVAPPPPLVLVTPVREGAIQEVEEVVGRTAAVEQVEIEARVEGALERRSFVEGDTVRRGELLFTIERAPYAAAVSRAQAAVADAEAALANAQQYRERLDTVSEDAVAGAERDQAKADELAAEATLASARADLETAGIDLGYTRITAPISGTIGRALVTEGNVVGPDSGPLATIVQLDPIHVLFAVTEREVLSLRQEALAAGTGDPIYVPRLKLANGTVFEQPGAIDFVDNQVNPATGTLIVRAVFPNPSGLLVPGQFVTVIAERQDSRPALFIPQTAVQQAQDGPSLLVVEDDSTVAARPVTLGDRVGDEWELLSGAAAGERVIVQGAQKVQPGMPVTAQPYSAPAGGGSPGPAEAAGDVAPADDSTPESTESE
ncbi:MAG: efflux RND transporter periplasmic adaptor subunit [Acidobacteriota bacterium]